MERKDLPVWLERVVERKKSQAEELAAHVADVPSEAQARRVRFRGATADLDRTLDRQREIRAAATTPGPARDPSTSG